MARSNKSEGKTNTTLYMYAGQGTVKNRLGDGHHFMQDNDTKNTFTWAKKYFAETLCYTEGFGRQEFMKQCSWTYVRIGSSTSTWLP